MCWRHCNLAASEPGSSFVQFVFQGSLREKSSNTLQLPSLTETLSEKKGRAFGFVLPFPNPLDMWTLGCAQSCGIHSKNKDWQLDHLFIDLCWGCTGLRCSLAVQQSLISLAHVGWTGWTEWSTKYRKANDEICPAPAKPADVRVQHYQPAPAELCALWAPTLSSLAAGKLH